MTRQDKPDKTSHDKIFFGWCGIGIGVGIVGVGVGGSCV
jgi:hypothetical protein